MSPRKLSALIAISVTALFFLLNFIPLFRAAERRVYDLFLHLSPARQRIDNVVFLDIDDGAVAKVGVFPWPRSVMAEGLLRLKEYDAKLAIFDIEYINKSPTQVDEVYLKHGLERDYTQHFGGINAMMGDLLNAIAAGNIPGGMASFYINDINNHINNERKSLFDKTLRLTRDDDLLLSQAAALYGSAWGTLNIQDEPLSGEQAQRRAIAEKRFSYPVNNSGAADSGADILATVPLFAQAVRGAGFTNIEADPDGVRRRISLAREVQGHWYLQLAFAPLIESWGSPPITVQPRRFIIDKPEGKISIPLDENGAMLLDWPREDYRESYSHVSFERFSELEDYEAHIEEYLSALEHSNETIFPSIVTEAAALLGYFDRAREAKRAALEECSDANFNEYIAARNKGIDGAAALLAVISEEHYIENEANRIINIFARNGQDITDAVMEEAQYCQTLFEYIGTELNAFYTVNRMLGGSLKDKICIIGRVDTGTTDIGVNPFHGVYVNVGTHAVVLDTILSNSFITPLPFLWSVLFAILFVPLALTVTSGFSPGRRAVLCIAGIALAFGLPLSLFIVKRIFLSPLEAVLAMTVSVILREIIAFSKSDREKKFIRRAFSTYLSAGVVEELIADPSKLNLGGEKREMTAIFTDIQGFSTISEQLDPQQLVRLLNRYLTVMSNIIMENQGTIDKYEGDAIIAFFGAPVRRQDHAVLACRSALAMKAAEQELNKAVAAEGLSPTPLFTRIGINTGEMVVGNMGAESKMDYTIMGNAVNLAARLEGVNKQYRTGGILISEYTKEKIGDEFPIRRLDRVRVVGIHTPVRLYELTGTADTAYEWEQAIDLFEQKQFMEAAIMFHRLMEHYPDDKVAELYHDRCLKYTEKPPAPDWDGVFSLSEK